MNRILVIAAHPDDEVLGCGATVCRLSANGAHVRIVILGEGMTSRFTDSPEAHTEALRALHTKTAEAAQALGLTPPMLYGLPDNRFDSLPLLEIVKVVESEVENFAPDTVFTHFRGDLNIDHTVTFRAVLTALRPMPQCPVRRLFSFEVPSATEWAFGSVAGPYEPDTFFDVSETLGAKVKAMQTYESEVRPFPHPRSPESLLAMARMRGASSGLIAAEAFKTIWSIQ